MLFSQVLLAAGSFASIGSALSGSALSALASSALSIAASSALAVAASSSPSAAAAAGGFGIVASPVELFGAIVTPNAGPTSLTPIPTTNDVYKLYSGPANPAVWPSMSQWISSFDIMFGQNLPILKIGCQQFGVPLNSVSEILLLKDAIRQISAGNGVDARFILAIVLQESSGCVRVPTTYYSHANPGLMQDNQGTGTCNQNNVVQNPCPQKQIIQMIQDGATGTASGPGLAQLLPQAPLQTDMKYYQAARLYNSGSIDPSGDLERGVATHCYASDVANRLTGWVSAPSTCYYDIDGLPPLTAAAATTPLTPATQSPGAATAGGTTFLTSVVGSQPTTIGTVVGAVVRAVATNPAPGVSTSCAKYYTIQAGDWCSLVMSKNSITLAQFLALNPGINSSCTNLWAGYDYCVQGL